MGRKNPKIVWWRVKAAAERKVAARKEHRKLGEVAKEICMEVYKKKKKREEKG